MLITKLAKKGNTKQCNNWRGKTVLSVFRKVLCRFIIIYYYNYRITRGVDVILKKEQAGYRKGRGDERTGIYTAGRD